MRSPVGAKGAGLSSRIVFGAVGRATLYIATVGGSDQRTQTARKRADGLRMAHVELAATAFRPSCGLSCAYCAPNGIVARNFLAAPTWWDHSIGSGCESRP